MSEQGVFNSTGAFGADPWGPHDDEDWGAESNPEPPTREVLEARALKAKATRQWQDACRSRDAAIDAVEDAAGRLRVARTKLVDVEEDENSKPHMLVAADEAVAAAERALERAKQLVPLREDDVSAARADVDAAEALLAQAHSPHLAEVAHDEASADVPRPVFTSVDQWVDGWLLPTYRRDVGSAGSTGLYKWDPEWWLYSEIVQRLEALWLSWEKMRLEGGPGMVVFFRDYLDPMMSVILSPEGPLSKFSPSSVRTERLAPMPAKPVPEGIMEFPPRRA